MTDEAAMIAAVLADPDDDAPRLIYADWLDEHDQGERAEFIRVQVRLAGWGCPDTDRYYALHGCNPTKDGPACRTLRRRERDLMTPENLTAWSGIGRPITEPNWRRGFVETIDAITAADWLAHADKILAAQPVRRVTLTTYLPMPMIRPVGEGRGGLEGCYPGMSRWVRFGAAKDMFALLWDGVEFDLPPCPNCATVTIGDGPPMGVINWRATTSSGRLIAGYPVIEATVSPPAQPGDPVTRIRRLRGDRRTMTEGLR